MPWRFGVILAHDNGTLTVGTGRQKVRGTAHPPLHARCRGWLVLVDLEGDRFSKVRVVKKHPRTSDKLPPVPSLRQRVHKNWGPVHLLVSSAGEWGLDSLGRPCELGRVRHHAGGDRNLGSWVGLVNYTGHRLSDLPLAHVVAHLALVDDTPWLVLTDVPAPPPAPVPASTPGAHGLPLAPDPFAAVHPPPAAPVPAPPPPPAVASVDLSLPAHEVTWLDDAITVPTRSHGPRTVPLPEARAAFDPLVPLLPKTPPITVHVRGTLGPGDHTDLHATVTGPLEPLFRYAGILHARARAERSPAWVSVDDLAAWAGVQQAEGASVLIDPSFGMDLRVEAFQRLFQHRATGQGPIVWRRRMVLFPVQVDPSLPVAWAWETTEHAHATYVFVPQSTAQLACIRDTLSAADFSRSAFLADDTQRRATAFAGRVHHSGDVDTWWARLVKRVSDASAARSPQSP